MHSGFAKISALCALAIGIIAALLKVRRYTNSGCVYMLDQDRTCIKGFVQTSIKAQRRILVFIIMCAV